MNAFKIALQLFKNNLYLYRLYITVLALAVTICYNFFAVSFNPYMRVLSDQYVYARTASILGSIVLIFTVIFFMFHANSFFYKLRYREIGIYLLGGVLENMIGAVFAIESVITGFFAIAAGLPTGILFSKLFFMLMSLVMSPGTGIPFYISPKPILLSCGVFTLIILVMGIKNFNRVKRSRLITILNTVKEEQKPPKLRITGGISGVILIAAAYCLALNINSMPEAWPLSFMKTAILSLVLTCAGTYCFFGSMAGLVIALLIRNKKIIYKKTRLVSFSNTLFRLKTNYRSLSVTAILCAAALAALSGGLGLKYFADMNTVIEAPYSITVYRQNDAVKNRILELIEESDHVITSTHESHFICARASYSIGSNNKTEECLITSLSEAVNAINAANTDSRTTVNSLRFLTHAALAENETIRILHPNLVISTGYREPENLKLNDENFSQITTLRAPFAGDLKAVAGRDIWVVSDSIYRRLKDASPVEQSILSINISRPQDSIELVQRIASVMKNPIDNLNSFAGQFEYKYYLIGAFYFMGLVMAVIFIISSFSTMYFKLLSDAVHDRKQYRTLLDLGMSGSEVRQCVFTQTGLAFFPAVILGVIHGTIAIKTLESVVQYRLTSSLAAGTAVILIIMTVFFFIISYRYERMVSGEKINETTF